MEIFQTIITGAAIFVLGQIFLKMVIDPIQETKRVIAKVRIELIRSGHILHNSENFEKEVLEKVFDSFRSLSAELIAGTELIPLYPCVSKLFGLPRLEKMRAASTNLIALSNWMLLTTHDKQIGHILKNNDDLINNLGFYVDPSGRISKDVIKDLIKVNRK